MSEKLKAALSYLADRLSENSTWRGLILFATGIGITVQPELAAKITAVGLGVVGVVNILRTGAPTKTEVAQALETKADKTP